MHRPTPINKEEGRFEDQGAIGTAIGASDEALVASVAQGIKATLGHGSKLSRENRRAQVLARGRFAKVVHTNKELRKSGSTEAFFLEVLVCTVQSNRANKFCCLFLPLAIRRSAFIGLSVYNSVFSVPMVSTLWIACVSCEGQPSRVKSKFREINVSPGVLFRSGIVLYLFVVCRVLRKVARRVSLSVCVMMC